MLDQESTWQRFLSLISDSTESSPFLAKKMELPVYVVEGYRDQIKGKEIAKKFGESKMPQHIVGFRYRRLPRWIMTPDIMRARADYDEGIVEVCQGKNWVRGEEAYILYAIPRKHKRKVKRGHELAYFSRIEE